jgi:Tfp pilus assembly protein PilV
MWKKASATKYVGQSEGELGPVLSRSCRSVRSEMMTYYQTSRRRGVTILEVLVSIFVLLIGVTGVIALFPVGVRLSQQAADDVLSAMTAQNALAAVLAEPGLRNRVRAYVPAGQPNENPDGDVTGWDGSTLKGLDGITANITAVSPDSGLGPTAVKVALESVAGSMPTIGNLGFESPSFSGWKYWHNMTSTEKTNTIWAAENLFVISASGGIWSASSASSPSGGRYAGLQLASSVSQAISGFEVGKIYRISFYEAYRVATLSGNDLGVFLDSSRIYYRASITDGTWRLRNTNTFVATQTAHTIRFQSTNPLGSDRTTLIDGISITPLAQEALSLAVHGDGSSGDNRALMLMTSGQAQQKLYRLVTSSQPNQPVLESVAEANFPFDDVKAGDEFRLLGARDVNNAWATVPAGFYKVTGPFHLGRGAVEGYGYLAIITRLEGQDDTFRVDILVYKGYNSSLPPEGNLPAVACYTTIVSGDMLN